MNSKPCSTQLSYSAMCRGRMGLGLKAEGWLEGLENPNSHKGWHLLAGTLGILYGSVELI